MCFTLFTVCPGQCKQLWIGKVAGLGTSLPIVGPLLETHKHDIGDILLEVLEHERDSLKLYKELLILVEGETMLEEYARGKIFGEESHLAEVDKMLRRPGEITAFAAPK